MEVRYPPPQKGYLSDTCAIPYENKAHGCDTPHIAQYGFQDLNPSFPWGVFVSLVFKLFPSWELSLVFLSVFCLFCSVFKGSRGEKYP